MKRAQFVMALCSVTGLAAVLQASDCDCPKPKSCTQCQCRDDSGILDHVDKVAGQFHASFKKNFKLMSGLSRLGKSDCDASPSCGCEVKPSCGSEIKPSCGCEVCGTGTEGIGQSMVEPSQGHPVRTQSQSIPNNLAPQSIPDAQVDPFVDEAPRSGQSKVRGRTIQYRTNSQPTGGQSTSGQATGGKPNGNAPMNSPSRPMRPSYGQQYDSQAQRTIPSQPRQLQLIAPASGESQTTVEQVFNGAYKVKLSDQPDQSSSSKTSLRPVPGTSNSNVGDNVSSRNVGNRIVVAKEPVGDLNDPYERGEPIQLETYENPLRR